MIASKCHKKGYEVVQSILPILSWETIKKYLTLMFQEMTRRGCKGIGGIHWDDYLLCKRTGEFFRPLFGKSVSQ